MAQIIATSRPASVLSRASRRPDRLSDRGRPAARAWRRSSATVLVSSSLATRAAAAASGVAVGDGDAGRFGSRAKCFPARPGEQGFSSVALTQKRFWEAARPGEQGFSAMINAMAATTSTARASATSHASTIATSIGLCVFCIVVTGGNVWAAAPSLPGGQRPGNPRMVDSVVEVQGGGRLSQLVPAAGSSCSACRAAGCRSCSGRGCGCTLGCRSLRSGAAQGINRSPLHYRIWRRIEAVFYRKSAPATEMANRCPSVAVTDGREMDRM